MYNLKPSWAPKVSKAKIQRLYLSDAGGILDEELLAEVGWALWSRCDSILTVTAAHYGRLPCPSCGAVIEHGRPWADEETAVCGACGWQMSWAVYHQTYKGKQLFGANAVEAFEAYHKAFPQAREPGAKMVLIDQLIHAFHLGLTELGRPAAANLIEGSLKEVIQFLDALTSGGSREAWRRALEGASWSRVFLDPGRDEER